MLGMNPTRHPPPGTGQVVVDDEHKRLADLEERRDALRRVEALDLRIDVLTRRVSRHERKPNH